VRGYFFYRFSRLFLHPSVLSLPFSLPAHGHRNGNVPNSKACPMYSNHRINRIINGGKYHSPWATHFEIQCTLSMQGKKTQILISSIKRSEYAPDLIRPSPERIVTENGHFASALFDFFPRDNFHYVHTLAVKFLTGLSLSRMFNELLNLRHTVF
jgi:hypothetical protein